MVLKSFVLDQDTGEAIATFGLEVDIPRGAEVPWLPQRWALVRCYTVPATGPAGHSWAAWSGAVAILLAVYVLLAYGVWR